MPLVEVKRRLGNDKTFVLLKRQVDADTAGKLDKLAIDGVTQIADSKRFYPEGESAAHVVGFTNVEDKGQEGVGFAANARLVGTSGQREVIRDRLGRIVSDTRPLVPAQHGATIELTIDRRIQQLAFSQLKAAVVENNAVAGSVVVLDAQNGEILALANYPTFDPNDRARLTGQQLRNRAVIDTFEPGPTIAARRRAVDRRAQGHAEHDHQHVAGHLQDRPGRDPRHVEPRVADGVAGTAEVEQRRAREARAEPACRNDLEQIPGIRDRPRTGTHVPGRRVGPAARLQALAADRAGDDGVRLRPVDVAAADRADLHGLRRRRHAAPGVAAEERHRPADDRRASRPPRDVAANSRGDPLDARDGGRRRRHGRARASTATGSAARRVPRASRSARPMRRASTARCSPGWRR